MTAPSPKQGPSPPPAPTPPASERKHFIDWIALVLSVGALIAAIFSVLYQVRTARDAAVQTAVHDQYELCRVLDQLRLENPEISHMLALPSRSSAGHATREQVWANYSLFHSYVAAMLRSADSGVASRERLYLQEHAVALHVFDIDEQTVFQRDLAKASGDQTRHGVLSALVTYYEQHLLRNPRLRFHWDHGGADMMEASTRSEYDREVRPYLRSTDYVDPLTPLG